VPQHLRALKEKQEAKVRRRAGFPEDHGLTEISPKAACCRFVHAAGYSRHQVKEHHGEGSWLWLWFSWLLANAAAGAVLGILNVVLGGFPFMALLFGCVFGLVQWLVLRRHLSKAGRWVSASALGGPVGFYLSMEVVLPAVAPGFASLNVSQEELAYDAVLFLVFWAVMGVAQWLVLRRQVQRALWWAVLSAISGAGFGVVAAITSDFVYRRFTSTSRIAAEAIVFQVAAGATVDAAAAIVYGALTGLGLLMLLPKLRYTAHTAGIRSNPTRYWPNELAGNYLGNYWSNSFYDTWGDCSNLLTWHGVITVSNPG